MSVCVCDAGMWSVCYNVSVMSGTQAVLVFLIHTWQHSHSASLTMLVSTQLWQFFVINLTALFFFVFLFCPLTLSPFILSSAFPKPFYCPFLFCSFSALICFFIFSSSFSPCSILLVVFSFISLLLFVMLFSLVSSIPYFTLFYVYFFLFLCFSFHPFPLFISLLPSCIVVFVLTPHFLFHQCLLVLSSFPSDLSPFITLFFVHTISFLSHCFLILEASFLAPPHPPLVFLDPFSFPLISFPCLSFNVLSFMPLSSHHPSHFLCPVLCTHQMPCRRLCEFLTGLVHLYVVDRLILNWHSSCHRSPLSKGHHIWPADIISVIFGRGLFTQQGPEGHLTLVSQTVVTVATNRRTPTHTIPSINLIQSTAVSQETVWLTFWSVNQRACAKNHQTLLLCMTLLKLDLKKL